MRLVFATTLLVGALYATRRPFGTTRVEGPLRTGTIVAGEQRLFSYELRQTDGRVLPVITELLVCQGEG